MRYVAYCAWFSAFLVLVSSLAGSEITKDLAMAKPLRLISVTPDRTSAPAYERITLAVDLEAAYENPFDSSDIGLEASVESANGTLWAIPGFLYQPYERRLDGGYEKLAPAGPPQWKVRLSLPAPGRYTVTVTATNRSATATSEPLELEVTSADVPGMVCRHATDRRYFVTDRGETFFPIGANVCWGSGAGTFSYDTWLPKYAGAGCNFLRVWLSPSWVTFGINTRESGFDGVELANAWRLDYVLELAERLGLRVMLCIDSFNILRSKEHLYGHWEDSPYIRANGGPLDTPAAYFTDETMRAAYRDRLRYLVARYGYSPNVFAWEFWNEVDVIDDYDSETVTRWHRETARYLRTLDPWRHLITTSTALTHGDPRLDAVPELEFVQTHRYMSKDVVDNFGRDRATKAAAQDRPHFHGEFGITHGVRSREMDPVGIHLHNALYSCVGQMQAGTPMTWWWDSYVEPRDLYHVLGAFSRWIAGFDFVAQQVQPVVATVTYTETTPMPVEPLVKPNQVSWDPGPSNQPMTVHVDRGGVLHSQTPLAGILHGVRNHPDLHNPVTFEVDAPDKTSFGVIVEGVSGHGGAALEITLDGRRALSEDFPDTDSGTDTLTKYSRIYRIKIPEGRHTVNVENTGNDWFYVAYTIPWLRGGPPLRVIGLRGQTMGLVWIQNRLHTWRRATETDYAPVIVERARIRLDNWPAGPWRIDLWDTIRGEVTSSKTVTIGEDGRLDLSLPCISWDAAFRFHAEPS